MPLRDHRDGRVQRALPPRPEQPIHQQPEQRDLKDERREIRHLKPERLEPAPERVIDRQRHRDDRPVRLIRGQRAERRRIGEEPRDIIEAPDEGVIDDRVRVVEVEPVFEVVRVCRRDARCRQERQERRYGDALAQQQESGGQQRQEGVAISAKRMGIESRGLPCIRGLAPGKQRDSPGAPIF